jgi:CelD/BcsL family acetyltransferase involved in cellulose biosynthesis
VTATATLSQTNDVAEDAPALRVDFVTDLAQLPALAARWEALAARKSDHESLFVQSDHWCRHLAAVRTTASSGRFRMLIATVWRGQDLIGLWPLSLQRASGAWIARSLDDPFGQFAGVLFRDMADIAPGVAAIVEALRKQADGLQIEAVIAGTPLHAALRQAAAMPVGAQQAVYIDLRPFASFKDFAQTVNSKTRKNLRNLTNRLQREHQSESVVIANGGGMPDLLRDTFDERFKWLQRNGRTSAAFQSEDFRPLVAALPQSEGLELIGFALGCEKKWVSTQWGFLYAGRYYAYMSAMDPAYDQFSPGRLHLGMVIEACTGRGVELLELMPPATRYKLEWTDSTRQLETLCAGFTLRGRIALGATRWVMPKVRHLSRMLPESVRRALVGRLNRQ